MVAWKCWTLDSRRPRVTASLAPERRPAWMPSAAKRSSRWKTVSSMRASVRLPVGGVLRCRPRGGDQHRVHPAHVVDVDRKDRDVAHVVGMEDEDRVREHEVREREVLAEVPGVEGRVAAKSAAARRAVDRPHVRADEIRHRARVEKEAIDRVSVQDADVVGLEEGVDHELPVGAPDGVDAAIEHVGRKIERRRGRRRSAEDTRRGRARCPGSGAPTAVRAGSRSVARRGRGRRCAGREAPRRAARVGGGRRDRTSSRGTGRRGPSSGRVPRRRRGACRDGGRR